MSNVNLNLYKIFCVVATSKSYNEASKKINQTVANISTQISTLESQLNTKLFNKGIKGVTLTEEGKELYNIISKSILAFDYGEKVLKEKNNNIANGEIRIGCPSHLSIYYLMDAVKKAQNDYPNLKINVISFENIDKLAERLYKHEIDFMINNIIPKSPEGLNIKELKTTENIFVSKKPIKIIDVKELENLRYILNFETSNSTKVLMEKLNEYGVNIKYTFRCDATEVRVDAVKKELGIGYVIKDAVKKEIDSGELYEVEVPIDLPKMKINLLYVKEQLRTIDKIFIKNYLK